MRLASLLMQKLSNLEHFSEGSGMCPSSYSDYRKFMLKIVIPQYFGMIHNLESRLSKTRMKHNSSYNIIFQDIETKEMSLFLPNKINDKK